MYGEEKMKVDVIIVKYNTPELEEICIQSVVDNTEIPYRLTIFDNYQTKHNIGQLWNKLISESSSDYICLLNSDTKVTPKWLSKLLKTFDRVDKVGCVGPSTDNSHNQQSREKPEEVFVDFGKTYPKWCIGGFCLVFPKKVWEEVGGFPEDFGFYGQEVALVDRIMSIGYKQIWRTDVFVHHEGSASVKKAEKSGEMSETLERQLGKENCDRFRFNKI